MKETQLKEAVLAAAMGLLLSTPGYARAPLWGYSAPNPASVTVSSSSTETVQYTVTNHSRKPKKF